MEKEFSESFMLYRAKNDGSGAASQWSMSSKKDCVFLEMGNQKEHDAKGNARFDWDKKISFKLGVSDIGEILSVLAGRQKGVGQFDKSEDRYKGLFHSNPKGNAILYFGIDKNNRLHIYLSVKRGDEKVAIQHTISSGEGCVLDTLLRRAIEIIYRWN